MARLFNLLLDLIITAIALWAVTLFVPGVELWSSTSLAGNDRMWTFIAVAALFLVVNAVVKPILEILGLPLTCLTFGLFALVINAAVFAITAWISGQLGLGFYINGFWAALIGAAVMALARGLLGVLTGVFRAR